MKGENIRERTMEFAVRILNMATALPKDYASQVIARIIIQSSSCAGANYRSVCRATSRVDFVNRLKMVEKELDETGFWLELIDHAKIFPSERISPLIRESGELLSIMERSIKTAKENGKRVRSNKSQKTEKSVKESS